jgi:hypothetical protein
VTAAGITRGIGKKRKSWQKKKRGGSWRMNLLAFVRRELPAIVPCHWVGSDYNRTCRAASCLINNIC